VYRKFLPGLPAAVTVPEPYDKDGFTLGLSSLRQVATLGDRGGGGGQCADAGVLV
jgi:hypothetical protein